MAQRESGTHQAIFFIDNHSVSKRMLFSEFEALLDGMGTLPEYADSDAEIVYGVISKAGKIKALVFFKLYFDEDGRADPSWNVPIERFAEISGSGPDLGGGPIRLACRSQCSINWHQDDLWDPGMTPGSNDFVLIKKAVEENRLRLPFQKEQEKVPVIHSISDEDLDDELALESEKRVKLARLLKEQRLRIRTLESQRDAAGDSSEREQRIIVHAYKNEIQTLKQHLEQLRVTNERLQEKLTSRNAQFIDLQDKVSLQTDLVANLEKKLSNADESERAGLEKQKLEAELELLKDKLERKEIDLAYRDEREDLLRAELEELKERQSSSADGAGDGIVSRLRELEVVCVAYHAGAGHINMNADEIPRYVVNPIAFVAEKCFVTEDHYRAWLKHYESPTCEQCHCPIEKVTMPSEFEPGISNLCEQHQV